MKMNSVVLAGVVLALAGCKTVQNVQPTVYIPEHNPPVVWVTYLDNSFVPVSSPKIVGDSLVGTWQGLSEPVAISLKEIQTVQAKMPSPKRTIILASVLTLAVGGAVYSITQGANGPQDTCGSQVIKGTPTDYCCPVNAGEKGVTC
jgi:hypothetical protein